MKISHLSTGLILFASVAFASCGGSTGSSSASGCFGGIPEMIDTYKQKSDKLSSETNESNYKKKSQEADNLKTETTAAIEKAATALSNQEVDCTVEESQLKIEKPVVLVFKSMNKWQPVFGLGGEVVAATDLTLAAKPSDLDTGVLFSKDEMVITVKMPVAADFIGKDGAVVKHLNDIGTLQAEHDGKTAVVKAGTPVDFSRTFTVTSDYTGVESIHLYVELEKAPYTSRSLNK